MMWQDIVLLITTVVFSVSLIPQVYDGFKNKVGPITYKTSVPTAAGLFVTSAVYVSLSLYFASAMCFVTGILWSLLIVQRKLYGKRLAESK